MGKFERLANDLFELDNVSFEELEVCMRDILKKYGFVETSHITFADGGMPVGTTNRKAYYSPQMEAAVVVELSQDWDDWYDYEKGKVEWKDFYHYRVYVYDAEAFNNNDLYFIGDYMKDVMLFYYRNNYNDLYAE